MKRFLTIVSLALALVPVAAFSGEAEEQAVKAAEGWLVLADQGKNEESWKEAATLFRSAVTVEQWRQAMDGARKPLGELKSRELMGAEYHDVAAGSA